MFNRAKEYGITSILHRQKSISIGPTNKLSLLDVKLLAHHSIPVVLNPAATNAMQASYEFLQQRVAKRIPVYGINTNFGDQVSFIDEHLHHPDARIYYQSINARQTNIIKSLACSQGQIIAPDIIKTALLLRAHSLAQGYSAVHPNLVLAMLNYLNADITPIVRCYGSIGASGDLIPLATIAAGIIGADVPVLYQQKIMLASEALQLAGLVKYQPELRDGLAMINGTSFMTAIASLALYDLQRLFPQMLAAMAMTLESIQVITSAYHPLVHHVKHHSGQVMINQFLTNFWAGSQLLTDLDELRNSTHNNKAVQDYYSFRSIPQGFGPFMENLERATLWIENEMNSVNDNPIIDPLEEKIHHNANFMGYYITDACDILKMNMAQAATWIHALIANLVHPRKNHLLPANLVNDPSKNNGFRSMQLLAAALAVQNRKLAQSQQAFTLPTEGDNQDVNSLGTHAALDFQEAVANLERLTAILLLTACQALELRGVSKASPQAQEIFALVRASSATIKDCRPMSDEVSLIVQLLRDEKM